MKPLPIVVLISGFGSNLQAMMDAMQAGLAIEIRAVISDQPEAQGLKRAKQAGIATEVIARHNFPNRNAFDQALLNTISQYHPQLIVLAGFMRILRGNILGEYHGRIVNIHPSLLPKHPGLDTHQRVLTAGDKVHGVSIHFVTDKVDGGPMICQATLTVNADDTPETLKARIHILEHQLYPRVLAWFINHQLELCDAGVKFKGKLLPNSGKLLNL